MNKLYLTADTLLAASFDLALQIAEDQFMPNLIVGIWRGGSPVAIAVHEMFDYLGHQCAHCPITTHSYKGINQRAKTVEVTCLDLLLEKHPNAQRILLVDDVFDTGLSIEAVMQALTPKLPQNADVRIATPYYKPANNQSAFTPHYYLHQTSDWIVFPHELCGLKLNELIAHKPAINALSSRLKKSLKNA